MDNVRSLWLRPRKARRGEPPLTLPRIAEAAVELLDAEGIDRLTMRRLAERLAISAPSLYWHVDTKDDVLDLAVDAIFGELTPAPRDDGWRANVTEVITAWRTILLRHPWAASVPARRRPAIGPNFLSWMERLQSALAAAGFTGPDLAAATWALYNHVFGSAAAQTALTISAEERRIAQEKLRTDGFPTLAASGYFHDDDWDGGFTRGLGFLLDGLERQERAESPGP
ncbi:TetR/AcrR family transcriptional regulator C-terminal domain-containing protein [Amycolatopsis suaedae]|uniref:TetR/AcrR family transcriptional regulator C-terminal domain-containing protein n=1 Tax=Amycolatopsis suaedae TaxID=2510978 RepID=UPI001F108BEE|nr:TetR/AcrR family transcriptional regulator C-terminal domain-containing protein [Amycolatopsis suaedae]